MVLTTNRFQSVGRRVRPHLQLHGKSRRYDQHWRGSRPRRQKLQGKAARLGAEDHRQGRVSKAFENSVKAVEARYAVASQPAAVISQLIQAPIDDTVLLDLRREDRPEAAVSVVVAAGKFRREICNRLEHPVRNQLLPSERGGIHESINLSRDR